MAKVLCATLSFLILIVCMTSCKYETVTATPKPRGYPRVIYPEKAYQKFDENYCEFTFEYPKYAKILQDTLFFDEKPVSSCWFDLYIPAFEGRIHCSYYDVKNKKALEKLISEAHDLANKHTLKANYIDELKVQKPNHVSGFVFDIQGPAASPFQFYLTDSTKHFLRGALYFKTQARPDSLAPVLDFVKKDVMQLINTFEWSK